MLDALAGVVTPEADVADCGDTAVVRRALALSGSERSVDVDGCGAAMRFLTAYFACLEGVTTRLIGNHRLCERPVGSLVEALRRLGADIKYSGREGFPPLLIKGRKLSGGAVTLPGDVSSQYVSALMMIAPMLSERLIINVVPPVVSRPYILMTAGMISRYGALCRIEKPETSGMRIIIDPSCLAAPAVGLKEPDWTAASYWYETAALTGRSLVLPEMPAESLQGDAALTDYFYQISLARNYNTVLELNLDGTPDLAPTLAATCCGLDVPFRFVGLAALRIKESDRLTALCRELGRLGFDVEPAGDGAMIYTGVRSEQELPVRIATYGDHRMAMAMAPLAVLSPGLEIEDPEVVGKSYPGFWSDLRSAGYEVNIEERWQ